MHPCAELSPPPTCPVKQRPALLRSNRPRDSRVDGAPTGCITAPVDSLDRGRLFRTLPSPRLRPRCSRWTPEPCLANLGVWGRAPGLPREACTSFCRSVPRSLGGARNGTTQLGFPANFDATKLASRHATQHPQAAVGRTHRVRRSSRNVGVECPYCSVSTANQTFDLSASRGVDWCIGLGQENLSSLTLHAARYV